MQNWFPLDNFLLNLGYIIGNFAVIRLMVTVILHTP